MMSEISLWRTLLSAVSAVNIAGWLIALVLLEGWRGMLTSDVRTLRRIQVLLFSAGYVFGSVNRSVFPVYHVPRL